MFNKKGQGLSLNVIIVAALALIVLVVLVAIFTGRITVFDKGISESGDSELVSMKISYGDCHPTAVGEVGFKTAFNLAESVEEKDLARANFMEDIANCKSFSDKDNCESAGCRWD